MNADARPMRRQDRQISETEAWTLLAEAEYGVLSLIRPDGAPYGVPISFALVDRSLYMHGAAEGGLKVECIRHGGGSAAACFTVVGPTEVLPRAFSTRYVSVIVFGRARIVEDEGERERGLLALVDKYSPEFREEGRRYMEAARDKTLVLRLDVESLTGKGRT